MEGSLEQFCVSFVGRLGRHAPWIYHCGLVRSYIIKPQTTTLAVSKGWILHGYSSEQKTEGTLTQKQPEQSYY